MPQTIDSWWVAVSSPFAVSVISATASWLASTALRQIDPVLVAAAGLERQGSRSVEARARYTSAFAGNSLRAGSGMRVASRLTATLPSHHHCLAR
jgi:hypothetical protein